MMGVKTLGLLSVFSIILALVMNRVWRVMIKPYHDVHDRLGGVTLIGEVEVSTQGPELADEYFNELHALLDISGNDWVNVSLTSRYVSLIIESAKVLGPLKEAAMPVQRAEWFVQNCSRNDLFSFFTSPKGFRVIDPVIVHKRIIIMQA
jgi:hypothetical protein